MKINLQVNGLEDVRRKFQMLSDRSFKKATATGITRTAWKVRTFIQKKLPEVFDRPTPYTLSAIFVEEASANQTTPEASVRFMDGAERRTRNGKFFGTSNNGTPATKFLNPNVEGGKRGMKRFERSLQIMKYMPANWFVVPGPGANLDQYGNMSRGQVIQILSQLKIKLVSGFERNISTDARKNIAAKRKAGGIFFVVPVGKEAKPGIYQREFYGRNVTPVVFFVPRAIYKKRFPFYEMAQAKAQELITQELAISLQDQIKRDFK